MRPATHSEESQVNTCGTFADVAWSGFSSTITVIRSDTNQSRDLFAVTLAQLGHVCDELNWTDSQWKEESERYLAYWNKTYGVPDEVS